MRRWIIAACLALGVVCCRSTGTPSERPSGRDASSTNSTATPRPTVARDLDRERCQARLEALTRSDRAPGAPGFEAHRPALLGRARGQAHLWVREPAATPGADLPEKARDLRRRLAAGSPFRRLRVLKASYRADKPMLRALVLREGYLYSADPTEALALVNRLTLVDLFDEHEIFLQRGEHTARLRRRSGRWPEYLYAEGRFEGREAKLLLGDRVGITRAALATPLHRDVQALAHRSGATRFEVLHLTESDIDARLRFGETWVRALVTGSGAHLSLGCLDAPASLRRAVEAWQRADAPRREALRRLRATVSDQVHEKLPFDRPRGVDDHFSDGQLRPLWRWAYRAGRHSFEHEDETYRVFDGSGQPIPPQMCVDFVLDSFERAAGSWYRRRGAKRERVIGELDFDAHGIENRRGVLAFGQFAEANSELFAFHGFEGAERIPFGHRSRFFGYLVDHADQFQPGDVVAIQGRKRDGYVHQHAILIEDTDPITGMPYALADQMRRPRRRTWEGIMAEAPKRSLYFRARPTPELLKKLHRESRRKPGSRASPIP